MLLKCCIQYVSKFGKLNSGHRTGKGQFSFQSQRMAVPKNVPTQLSTVAFISHTSKVMVKILQARLQQYVNRELPDVQAGLEKAEEPEIKLPTSAGSWKKQEFQENIYFCFIDYAKASDYVAHNKLKFFKRWEYQTT